MTLGNMRATASAANSRVDNKKRPNEVSPLA